MDKDVQNSRERAKICDLSSQETYRFRISNFEVNVFVINKMFALFSSFKVITCQSKITSAVICPDGMNEFE